MAKSNVRSDGNGDAKLKALLSTISDIEKRFGKGAIMRLGERANQMTTKVIPTGSLSLDFALGVGGIPRGRITEIYGPESSGKTTLAYHVAAEAQKSGGTVIYIDVEHALDPAYARNCGIKIEDLLISQPDSGEAALEIADTVVHSGAVDVVIVDSVAALVPQAEINGEMGESHIGLQARLMSQAMRKLCSGVSAHESALIFINQLRDRIGSYGNPEVTPGGRALKFYASVRIDLRIKAPLEDSRKIRIGNFICVTVVKNKVAPPFGKAQLDIMFGQGISREGEILNLGEQLGILSKKGAYYLWDEQTLGQGHESARQFLNEHHDVAEKIEKLIHSRAANPTYRVEETTENQTDHTDEQGTPSDNHRNSSEIEAANEQCVIGV